MSVHGLQWLYSEPSLKNEEHKCVVKLKQKSCCPLVLCFVGGPFSFITGCQLFRRMYSLTQTLDNFFSTVCMRKRSPPGNSARNARTEWRKYEAPRRPLWELLAKRYVAEHVHCNTFKFLGPENLLCGRMHHLAPRRLLGLQPESQQNCSLDVGAASSGLDYGCSLRLDGRSRHYWLGASCPGCHHGCPLCWMVESFSR